ncbi:MAG: DUF2520 domain-containing protein [Rikenellaceae bacterium]
MKIVVIGAGGVAEALCRAIEGAEGLTLVQQFTRKTHVAAELAAADIYLLAVSDGAVNQLSLGLPFAPGAVVAHTAGSLPLEAVECEGGGVLYPMQSFTRGREVDFAEIPIFLEAKSEQVYSRLERLAHALSHSVQRMDSTHRRELHLAAVFGSNFVNAMYVAAAECAAKAGVGFEIFKPLIAETCRKAIESSDPRLGQTGPARRGDIPTQQRHTEMLGEDEKAEIYKLISKYIWETSKKM